MRARFILRRCASERVKVELEGSLEFMRIVVFIFRIEQQADRSFSFV